MMYREKNTKWGVEKPPCVYATESISYAILFSTSVQ